MPPKRAAKSTKTPEEIAKNLSKKETDKAIENIQDNLKMLKISTSCGSSVEDYKERNSNMKRRANHIAKISNFWLIALKNSSEVGPLFKVNEKFYEFGCDNTSLDPSPLHHLTELAVGFFRKPKVGFKLYSI